MNVNRMMVKGHYLTRESALQRASSWYGRTIGYLPMEEGRGKNKVPVTSVLDPEDVSVLLGKVVYEPQTKEYVLWLYPRCPVFRSISVGDKVRVAYKGWGRACMPNMEAELWLCDHAIASRENVLEVRKVFTV